MKKTDCSEIRERIRAGLSKGGDEATRHVEHCSECRAELAWVEAIKDAAGVARAADLSEEGIRTTRARVAEILEAKAGTSRWSSWSRTGWGWAVAASICVAAVFAVVSQRPDGPAVPLGMKDRDGRMSADKIDLEISRIQDFLDYKISQFQARHVGSATMPSFESRSRSVRDRIQMCSLVIHAELAENGILEKRGRRTL